MQSEEHGSGDLLVVEGRGGSMRFGQGSDIDDEDDQASDTGDTNG